MTSDVRAALDAGDDGFHEIQLNGKQLVFLGMATTLVSVVIFLCGVLVGRGVKPLERWPRRPARRRRPPGPARSRRRLATPAPAPPATPPIGRRGSGRAAADTEPTPPADEPDAAAPRAGDARRAAAAAPPDRPAARATPPAVEPKPPKVEPRAPAGHAAGGTVEPTAAPKPRRVAAAPKPTPARAGAGAVAATAPADRRRRDRRAGRRPHHAQAEADALAQRLQRPGLRRLRRGPDAARQAGLSRCASATTAAPTKRSASAPAARRKRSSSPGLRASRPVGRALRALHSPGSATRRSAGWPSFRLLVALGRPARSRAPAGPARPRHRPRRVRRHGLLADRRDGDVRRPRAASPSASRCSSSPISRSIRRCSRCVIGRGVRAGPRALGSRRWCGSAPSGCVARPHRLPVGAARLQPVRRHADRAGGEPGRHLRPVGARRRSAAWRSLDRRRAAGPRAASCRWRRSAALIAGRAGWGAARASRGAAARARRSGSRSSRATSRRGRSGIRRSPTSIFAAISRCRARPWRSGATLVVWPESSTPFVFGSDRRAEVMRAASPARPGARSSSAATRSSARARRSTTPRS